MEGLASAIDRLTSAGYRRVFVAAEGGLRRGDGKGDVVPLDRFAIDEVVRFEGTSDPGDEAIVFALRATDDGVRGTYTAAYGPSMSPEDADVVKALEAARGGEDHAPTSRD